MCVFFFRQKTAYEMRISDWSSDVCSSDLAQKVSAPQGRNTTDTPSQRHPIWYAWSDDGAMAAKRQDDSTVKPSIQPDASGLPLTIDGRKLDYGHNRRLIRVTAQGQLLASSAHNAFGHRIARRARPAEPDQLHLADVQVA